MACDAIYPDKHFVFSETIFGSRISRKCFSPLAFATLSFVYTLHCDFVRADLVSFVCTAGMIESIVCVYFICLISNGHHIYLF